MAVAALDIDERAAPATAAALAETRRRHRGVRVDVGDPARSIAAAARRVDERFGGCDLLCANVGVQQFGSIDRLTDDDWTWVLGVNVHGHRAHGRRVPAPMRRRTGWRHIAITASSGVLRARRPARRVHHEQVRGDRATARRCGSSSPEGIGVTIVFPAGMITRHLESSALGAPG